MLACFFYELGLCLLVSFSLEFIVHAGLVYDYVKN